MATRVTMRWGEGRGSAIKKTYDEHPRKETYSETLHVTLG